MVSKRTYFYIFTYEMKFTGEYIKLSIDLYTQSDRTEIGAVLYWLSVKMCVVFISALI
jgi:hypothetical protein